MAMALWKGYESARYAAVAAGVIIPRQACSREVDKSKWISCYIP